MDVSGEGGYRKQTVVEFDPSTSTLIKLRRSAAQSAHDQVQNEFYIQIVITIAVWHQHWHKTAAALSTQQRAEMSNDRYQP